MAGQCLDLLVSHASTAPEWKAEAMVTTAGGVISLVEPLPQLVQAMQCLLSEEIVTDVARTQTQIGVNVQKSAIELIDNWVKKASSEDVHDLATTAENALVLDLKQADVLISARTITQILENTVPEYLLDFYAGTNCMDWIQSREMGCASKTKALEAYGNIIQYLSSKYKSQPTRIIPIWKKSDLNATSVRVGEKTLTANGSLVRHCHLFIAKLFPALLAVDRGEGEEKKRIGLELERQAKIMFKICAALMKMMDNPKCFMTMFKFTMAMLEKNTVGNNHTLRELLKWLSIVAMKCMDSDHAVERALNTIADDLIQVLSDEDDECKYKFVETASQGTVCDFLASTIDKSLIAVKTVISFAGSFQAKDQRTAVFVVDEVLAAALTKCDHCCELTSRLLPLHSQFAVQRERLVQTLTTLFSAVQEPVDLMLSNVKTVPEMIEWKSLALLSKLLKERLQAIMAIADEHVGIFNPEELKGRKNNVRKDEVIYVKYVRAREALQSRVLLMSEALKEDRLNFQVKKNTIGMRDFRINLNTLKTRVVQNEEDEPRKKKRRATQSMERAEGQENDEESRETREGDDTTMQEGGMDTTQQSVVY
ncbi:hypothetical protein OESDEN_19934 [Oesophagostomum dentatum]|uniref:FANCI helical domain-containing protein n=1 Tax=Oesophagostomum dentatum TaxID=61180 RepID=A0A0B1S903_OESDE|nr:hypothetical protein OESDEN_19934 [Oesophagostomum dentatum]